MASVIQFQPSNAYSDARLKPSTDRAAARSTARAQVCSVAVLSGDLAAFAIAAILAFAIGVAPQLSPWSRAVANLRVLGVAWHGWESLLILVSLLSYFGGRGHYSSRVPSWTQISDVAVATMVALACDVFLTVTIFNRPLQPEAVLRWALLCPILLLTRAAVRQGLRAAGVWRIRTLIVAPGGEIEAARDALLSDPALGYSVIGSVAPAAAVSMSDDELLLTVIQRGADFVLVTVGGAPEQERALLDTLRRTGLPIALVPALRGMPVVGFRQHYFLGHDIVMLVKHDNLSRPLCRLLKSLFDQAGALALLLLLAPLMLGISLLIWAEGGPALYRHRRIGMGGRAFNCLKFRTMTPDADTVLRRVIDSDPSAAREWAETQKLRDDPRVTAIGRFLRRSSLDELPQLLNVLRGEMSLVGPRPIVNAEVRRYAEAIEYYYAIKPGLTGLWQVSGRSDTTYDGRVKLDVWYVRNWTLWHDIAILLRTIPAVFLQRGAQ